MQSKVDISLIICTRNRAKVLDPFLAALVNVQCEKSYEITVVDNGSTDDTSSKLENAKSRFPCPYIVVHESRKGTGIARNTGVAKSSGELLAFTDDDCYVSPDFLTTIVDAFSDENLGYITGRILLHDPSDISVTINEALTHEAYPPYSLVVAGQLQGANMAFSRRALAEVGGFDPMFGAGTPFPCDDCDVAERISSKGWAGAYVPDVVVSHHHRRKEADRNSLIRGYDRGRGAYHTKMLLSGSQKHGWTCWAGLAARSRWRRAIAFWEFVGSLHYLIALVARAISWRSQISAPHKINPHPYSSSQIPGDRE